jgi:hypothetical protein
MSHEHYDAHGDSEWACGGDNDCNAVEPEPECVGHYAHRWTSRGCGGCDSNPGVWSLGGTAYRFEVRCLVCGAHRETTTHGRQRNPGECDTVRYERDEADADEARAEMVRQDRNRRARNRYRTRKAAMAAAR